MAFHDAGGLAINFARAGRLIATLSVSLITGACAQVGGPKLPDILAAATGNDPSPAAVGKIANPNDLQTATAYWGKKFTEHPRNLESALNFSMNLKAMGRKKQALAVLQRASMFHSKDQKLVSEYGRLALDLGQVKVAEKVLAMLDNSVEPDWRVISARGTVLAKQGKYAQAIPFYERALRHKKDHPSLLSNLALAHAMNGEAELAERLLRQAADLGGSAPKVRQNLALVLGLQGKYDEATQISSRDLSRDRANADTQLIRRMVKLDPVRSPNIGATQVAGTLRPTANDAGAQHGAWNTQVAVSAPQ